MKKSTGDYIFEFINGAILIALAIVTLYPFLYVVFASLSDGGLLELNRGFLYKPLGFNIGAYKAVMSDSHVLVGYKNTFILLFLGTFTSVFLTSIGGFVISRRGLWLNKILIPMVLITMFFNGGIIPQFLLVSSLGIYDTYWAVVLPTAISTMNLFIMKTNFQSIPESIEEAATIDGANMLQYFVQFVLPLSKAVIAVMFLYYGVARWNEWFNPMLYLKNKDLQPLQLYIKELLISSELENMMDGMNLNAGDVQRISETLKYATIVVATVPILCVYPFIQKYFVKGVMIGAVKG